MWGRVKTLVLAVVVGSAALVPLFGDPRATPVTHPLWARMLLRAMDMTEAIRTSPEASDVFGTLAWRDSLSYPAERYLRQDGAVVREREGRSVMAATATEPAEVVYALTVVQPGDYQLRTRMAGQPIPPASAEIVPLGGGDAVETFTLVPETEPRWIFGGAAHLDPGTYGASILLPPGCTLSQVEVAPPCLNPIEPVGGWQPVAVTTVEDLSVTAVQTLDMEHELPPDATPIEIRATDFQVEGPPEAIEAQATAETLEARVLRAGPKGLRAVVAVDVPEAGLYSISGFVAPGAGQRWTVDGCRKAVVCPAEGAGWRAIMTQALSAGRHTLQVSLGSAATLDLVRIELKKSTPQDYVATLERLGFDPGPPGPVGREKAIAAMRFIGDKRQETMALLCGDAVVVDDTPLPPGQIADLPAPTDPVRPVSPPPPPIGPPVLPPQPPASPTTPTGR